MLDLPDEEVQLKRRFRFDGFKVWHDDVRKRLAEMPHLVSPFALVTLLVQLDQFALQSAHLRKRLYDGKRRRNRPLALENRSKHVKPLLRERLGRDPALRRQFCGQNF